MSPDTQSRLRLVTAGAVTVIHFLDSNIVSQRETQEVGDQLYALVEKEGHRRLLLDFSNVRYLSSAVLGKLVNLKKKVAAAKGDLKLCGIQPSLLEVFKITQLDKVFPIYDDQRTALGKF